MGGYFERVRKVQTTLTRIFIDLESVSHGLSENWDEISRKARKFKGFFRPKSGGLQKLKKGLHRNWDWFINQIRKSKRLRGAVFQWGGYFQFFTKNRPQKHQKRAILHTSQANGGARVPPPHPWLRYWRQGRISGGAAPPKQKFRPPKPQSDNRKKYW